MTPLQRLEWLFLKPLSTACLILAVVYFFQAAWFVGGVFVVVCFLIGGIGQSLHKDKSLSELARGTIAEATTETAKEWSHEDSFRIAKPIFYASWIVAIAAGVLMSHAGLKFYFMIPLALGVGIFCTTFLSFATVYPRAKTTRQSELRQKARQSNLELEALRAELAKLTFNADISARLIKKAHGRHPQKTEIEIYKYVIEEYKESKK
jgi:hypothetical protein